MIKIQFDRGQSPVDVSKQLDQIATKHLPFATSLALNRTAQLVRKAVVKEMQRVFDRPTPYTKNSLYIEPSTKQKLEAVVWMKDGSGRALPYSTMTQDGSNWVRYTASEIKSSGKGVPPTRFLAPEIFGGARSAKSHEKVLRKEGIMGSRMFAMPGDDGHFEDRYGNITGSRLTQMLSALRINPERDGYQSNETDKSRQRRKGKRPEYFRLGEKGIGYRLPGQKGPPSVFLWFAKSPNYRKRLDFFGVANKTIDENLERELMKAIQYAIKTAH